MKKIFPILFFLLIYGGINSYAQYSISTIEARLFYNENTHGSRINNVAGNFSENIIDNLEFTLANVIIGEGSAEALTNNTLVVVRVESGEAAGGDVVQLKLIVRNDLDTIYLEQIKRVNLLNEPSAFYVPFLLDETGCEALFLTAQLFVNDNIVAAMEKTIDFACAE